MHRWKDRKVIEYDTYLKSIIFSYFLYFLAISNQFDSNKLQDGVDK